MWISILFAATTLLTIYLFYKAANNSRITLILLLIWIALQGLIGRSGFYTKTSGLPPRFALLVFPPLIFILIMFVTVKGRRYTDQLNISKLTLLHVVRIPVELVILGLFIHKTVPQLMTFEGRNFDILSGISALFIWYFGFIKKRLSNTVILGWNIFCLLLLINIVASAILSSPFTFQQFGFEQPDIALMYFPFVWLPCCVVPLVLFSHLVSIRNILKRKV